MKNSDNDDMFLFPWNLHIESNICVSILYVVPSPCCGSSEIQIIYPLTQTLLWKQCWIPVCATMHRLAQHRKAAKKHAWFEVEPDRKTFDPSISIPGSLLCSYPSCLLRKTQPSDPSFSTGFNLFFLGLKDCRFSYRLMLLPEAGPISPHPSLSLALTLSTEPQK